MSELSAPSACATVKFIEPVFGVLLMTKQKCFGLRRAQIDLAHNSSLMLP